MPWLTSWHVWMSSLEESGRGRRCQSGARVQRNGSASIERLGRTGNASGDHRSGRLVVVAGAMFCALFSTARAAAQVAVQAIALDSRVISPTHLETIVVH
jgi:hypothetical protein